MVLKANKNKLRKANKDKDKEQNSSPTKQAAGGSTNRTTSRSGMSAGFLESGNHNHRTVHFGNRNSGSRSGTFLSRADVA